jgi:DNA-binding response OmpR family regulator
LLALAQQVGQIVPALLLIRRCRGYSVSEEDARVLIKAHIATLRQKLEQGAIQTHFAQSAGWIRSEMR